MPNQPFTLFPYTDLGNAKRYTSLFKATYQWIPELHQWFHWNGQRWEFDKEDSNTYRYDELLAHIHDDKDKLKALFTTQAISEDDYRKHLEANQRWHKQSQSAGKIRAAITLAKSQKGMVKSFAEFDSKGRYLGVNNGVINLKTKEVVVDNPNYFITKSCSADYDPKATCPNWKTFLSQVFEGDQSKVAFIQRLFGQALLGTAEKDKLIILCGNGANGKSTITDTMIELLGDYALNTAADTLFQSKGNGGNKEYYLAELKGVRLSIINESSKGAYLDEALVKSLVDSGEIQARKIYQEPISFQPVATPILTTNYAPRISADYSISRRLLFVLINFQLPLKDRNPNFRSDVLKPELSGILNWVLEGCYEYQSIGLNPPASIIEATEKYIAENDRIARFIEENLTPDLSSRMALQDAKGLYMEWAMSNGYKDINVNRLSMDFRQKGYAVEKRNNGLFHIIGIRKKTHEDIVKSAARSPSDELLIM